MSDLPVQPKDEELKEFEQAPDNIPVVKDNTAEVKEEKK